MGIREFYFSGQGRVTRKEFWLKLLVPIMGIGLLSGMLDAVLGTWDAKHGAGLFSGLFLLAFLVPSVVVQVKRFHDRDKSGLWTLVGLIPVMGQIWLLVELGFLRGTDGPNRFGPEPGGDGSTLPEPVPGTRNDGA